MRWWAVLRARMRACVWRKGEGGRATHSNRKPSIKSASAAPVRSAPVSFPRPVLVAAASDPHVITPSLGQNAIDTMLWHAVGGVALLLIIVAMTIWRAYERFVWRRELGRQVSWLYLACGTVVLLLMGLHGSLGAWLASEFGVHITADQLLAAGADLREVLP